MIKLTEDYYIDSDKFNWILVVKRTSKTGKTKGETSYEAWKFFPTLESLIWYVRNLKDKSLQSRKTDFDTYLSNISTENKKWREDIARLCEGIKKEWVKKNG